MKSYKLKKDTLTPQGGMFIKGAVLDQKYILDLFDLTEEDGHFKLWFEPVEENEFTKSDMNDFGRFCHEKGRTGYAFLALLDEFLRKRKEEIK